MALIAKSLDRLAEKLESDKKELDEIKEFLEISADTIEDAQEALDDIYKFKGEISSDLISYKDEIQLLAEQKMAEFQDKALKAITNIKKVVGPKGDTGEPGLDGQDGETPKVDYDKIIKAVVKKIPKPKDGKDGKDGGSGKVVQLFGSGGGVKVKKDGTDVKVDRTADVLNFTGDNITATYGPEKQINISVTDNDTAYIPKTQNVLLKDPTGFNDPSAVVINYDPTTQKVTLTGTWVAYYQGEMVTALTTGWVSSAHTNTTGHTYFLYYNGTSFLWADNSFPGFEMLLIATVNYGTTDKFANRECHGLMQWQTHKELHETIGTYKSSGGTIPSASYVLNSTTAANRRLDIDETTINDEDLPTVLPALTSKSYTQYNLTGASVGAYTLSAADIIPLSTNNPYYNSFTTPNWGQTLMPANSVATVWIYAIPVTSSATSQAYRYLFVQPQWVTQATNSSAGALTTAVNTESLRLPSELNLGTLTVQTPELVCIGKIIIDFTAANWRLRQVTLLTGNKFSQIGSPAGNFLSVVATDATLTGNGTGASPLKLTGLDVIYPDMMLDGTVPPDTYELLTNTGQVAIRKFSGTVDQDVNIAWLPVAGTPSNLINFRVVMFISESTVPASGETIIWKLAGCAYADSDNLNKALGTAVGVTYTAPASGLAQHDKIASGWSGDVTITDLATLLPARLNLMRDTANDTYAQKIGVAYLEVRYSNS